MFIINIINSTQRYTERIKLLEKMYVDNNGFIITRDGQKSKNILIIDKNILLFWWSAFLRIKAILKNTDEKLIVIDHGSGGVITLLKFFQRIRLVKKKNSILGLAIYNNNTFYFTNKVWNKDCSPPTLSLSSNIRYHRIWFFRYLFDKLYLKSSDFVLTNSIEIYNLLPQRVKPTHYMNNTYTFKKKAISLKNKDIDILYVGKIMPGKGIGCLFKAINELHKGSSVYYNIVLVGEISGHNVKWAQEIFKIYSQKFNFCHINFQSYKELIETYRRSKIFILPSFSEGSPRVILEAYFNGCEILASNIDPVKKLISDSIPISVFEPGCYRELANKLSFALENYNHENQTDRIINTKFTQENILSDLKVFLKELVA